MLAVRLPKEIEDRLGALAERTGRTRSFYVREAILAHLEDLEDLYLATTVLKRVRSGREKTRPLADVLARYGLDG
ncbi:MAG: type II toxin-antitoxin system RelB family antitoxin [Terriglobales bacterium]